MWQKPGTMQTMGSPTHKISAHPGADDDTDDEDEEEELSQDNAEIKESKEEMAEPINKYEPIKNLVEDPPSEAEDDR